MKWAADQVGKPWSPYGEGPHSYSCWGLVRAGFRAMHGIDMPAVLVGHVDESQVRAIKHAVTVSGWRRVAGARAVHDIVLMRSNVETHCGLVINANGHFGVLHSSHVRGVVYDTWEDATDGMTAELWRRHA